MEEFVAVDWRVLPVRHPCLDRREGTTPEVDRPAEIPCQEHVPLRIDVQYVTRRGQERRLTRFTRGAP